MSGEAIQARAVSRGRNRDRDNAYKRAEYRSEAPGIHKGDFVDRTAALYDPRRDGPMHHADPVAAMMGDPPIGWHDVHARAKA
jgi:hypothetical protein